MSTIITIDTILDWLHTQVEEKLPIDAHTWLDACQKITVLLGEEHDKLFDLQQKVAQAKVDVLDKLDMSNAEAKTRIEATDIYKESRRQEARIKRIEEMVRIAKIQSRAKDFEMRS